MVNEIIAVVLGYLLGSIPTAYIATRIATGKDIRQMGGGNLVASPEGFFVKGKEGPVKEGELERAASWAKELAK